MTLTDQQRAELFEFLKFEQARRGDVKAEVGGAIRDLLGSCISRGADYSGLEGREIGSKLINALDATLADELARLRDLNVVLIQTIFEQAQRFGFQMELEVPGLEDLEAQDRAGRLAGAILRDGPTAAITPTFATPSAPGAVVAGPPAEVDVDASVVADAVAERDRLKSQLSVQKRDWPEFRAAMQKLKELNARAHELRGGSGG